MYILHFISSCVLICVPNTYFLYRLKCYEHFSVTESACSTVKYVAPDLSTLVPATDLCSGSNAKWDLYLWIEVKVKVVPVLNSLSTVPWRCVGERRCSTATLDFGIRWKRVVIFLRQALVWEKSLGEHMGCRACLDALEHSSYISEMAAHINITELIKALPGNSSVNTLWYVHATVIAC